MLPVRLRKLGNRFWLSQQHGLQECYKIEPLESSRKNNNRSGVLAGFFERNPILSGMDFGDLL